jgi:hypothetical protein
MQTESTCERRQALATGLGQFVNAVNRANFHALRGIKEALAFHAEVGINHEHVFAFRDGFAGTFRFACPAGNASFVNGHGHGKSPQALRKQ